MDKNTIHEAYVALERAEDALEAATRRMATAMSKHRTACLMEVVECQRLHVEAKHAVEVLEAQDMTTDELGAALAEAER